MGIIESIKKGFGVAGKNLNLVLVLFVFNAIFNVAGIPLSTPDAAKNAGLTVLAVIFSILFVLLSIFIQSGSISLVRDFIKGGKANLKDFAKYGLKYYLRLLGIGVLIVLIIAIVGLVAALIVVATTPLNNQVVTTIAAIIAIIVGGFGLYYILLLMLSPYTVVCDELGIVDAMKRSVKVVRRSIGKVLLLLLALILISAGLGFVIGLATGLVTVALPVMVGQVIIALVNSAFNSYLGIVMMASFMVFYLSLVEKEKSSAQKVF